MSKAMKKSSRQKQRLFIKFLKQKTPESETDYKNYKNLFEKLKRKSKQLYYSSLLNKYQNNSKKTWQIMKEITGKLKNKWNNFPKMLKTDRRIIYNDTEIAEEFNLFFTSIRPKIADKISYGEEIL